MFTRYNIKNVILYLFKVISFCIILFSCFTVSKYFVINYDDSCHIFYDNEVSFFGNFFFDVYHGRYISNFLTKLIGYIIPSIFNIHPNVWIETGGALIKGIFYFLFVYLLAGIAFLNRKKGFIYVLIATLLYIFIQLIMLDKYQDVLYTSFYGFTFPFIIFFAFWKKFIIINKNNQRADYILYILAFLLGISTECTAIISTISMFLYIIIDYIQYKKISIPNIKTIALMILGNILYFTNNGFIGIAHMKGTLFDFKSTFLNGIKVYNEFIIGLKQVFISDYIYFIIPILVIILVIIFSKRIEHKSVIIKTSICLLIGQCIFYLCLLFAGRHIDGYLYVVHFDIILQMNIAFLFVFYLLISNFKNNYIFYTLLIFPFLIVYYLNHLDGYHYFTQYFINRNDITPPPLY